MANYVRIKHSKNLRFKLISLLYLLFVTLSLIQIPIEWLRVNGPISAYFLKPEARKLGNEKLLAAYDAVHQVDQAFLTSITDPATGNLVEPNEYSKTDQFFIKKSEGIKLHSELRNLATYYLSLPETEPKKLAFATLFASDMDHGLTRPGGTNWVEWKFKHTPASVAMAFLAELQLRINLLGEGLEVNEKADENEVIVRMAFNIENLCVGDSLKVVVRNKRNLKASISVNGQSVPVNTWLGDTLVFVPAHVGEFNLEFERNGVRENLVVNATTRGFRDEEQNKFQTFYEGRRSVIKYGSLPSAAWAGCNCDNRPVLNKQAGEIEFIPRSSGWCHFSISSASNNLLLADSVYVQAIPTPFISVDGSSEDRISYNRLAQTKMISFAAHHPEMPGFEYTIGSLRLRLVGIDNKIKSVNGSSVALTDEQVKKLKYLVVEGAEVHTAHKNFDILKQLVIQINR